MSSQATACSCAQYEKRRNENHTPQCRMFRNRFFSLALSLRCSLLEQFQFCSLFSLECETREILVYFRWHRTIPWKFNCGRFSSQCEFIREITYLHGFCFCVRHSRDDMKRRTLSGSCGIGIFVIAFVCICVAFATPSWIVSDYRITGAKLDRLGLWTHCFRSLPDVNDDYQRRFFVGCRWVFDPFTTGYDEIRGFLIPRKSIDFSNCESIQIVLIFVCEHFQHL